MDLGSWEKCHIAMRKIGGLSRELAKRSFN
jgi:hypothetical protein